MASSGNPGLSALRVLDPTSLILRVKHAVKMHNGNLSAAARDLGVSKRTLSRWLANHQELWAKPEPELKAGRGRGQFYPSIDQGKRGGS